MDTVKKLVAEDRSFDALATLIPMAQGGDAAAQYELAGFYHYGYVGSNDYTKALKWYRASARQGYADAMVGLSVMYLGGQGVAKDPREAYVWLNLAAQYMGDKRALAKVKSVRDEIGRRLSKDDIAFAKAESLLLQPESSSVQPNEAESIDHLPDTLPQQNAPASVMTEPLQNVPPDTGPISTTPALPAIQLQQAPPAAPTPPAASVAAPASTALPVTTLPATTMPATPLPVQTPPASVTNPAPTDPVPVTPAPADPTIPVKPIPEF